MLLVSDRFNRVRSGCRVKSELLQNGPLQGYTRLRQTRARLLRPSSWDNAKAAFPLDAVTAKVGMIYCQDRCQRLALCEMHKGGIREIHRGIRIAGHQRMNLGQFFVIYRSQNHSARANELPRDFDLFRAITDQVKQFSENGLSCQQRQSELSESRHASLVPLVAFIQKCKDCARINESVNGHNGASTASLRARVRSATGCDFRFQLLRDNVPLPHAAVIDSQHLTEPRFSAINRARLRPTAPRRRFFASAFRSRSDLRSAGKRQV